MTKTDMESKLRNFVLDTLLSRSGKLLMPDLISEITHEIIDRTSDLIEFSKTIEDVPQ